MSYLRCRLFSILLIVLLIPITYLSSEVISAAGEFAIFQVTIEVKDLDDSVISGAKVLAFSEDWGIRIPGTLDSTMFNSTDSNGRIIFRVLKGKWSFFIFHSIQSIRCIFLTTTLDVSSDITLILKPTLTFTVLMFSKSGNPIKIDEFRIMDEVHAPIVPTTSCGTSTTGSVAVSVNSQGPFRILVVHRPSGGSEGYYLMAKGIVPTQNLELHPYTDSTASVTFRAHGVDGSPTIGNVEVRLPEFDINNMVIDFTFTDVATVIFTPMRVVYNFRFFPNSWYFYFSSEAYELIAGSNLEIDFGGPLTKQLQIIPHASTGVGGSPNFAPTTQIWLKIKDQFGHILLFMSTPSGEPNFPFKIYQQGSLVFEASFPQGQPFTLKIDTEYTDSPSPTYTLSGDLGPFDTFSLNGDLISSDTIYQLSIFNSEHFRMAVPQITDQTNRITTFMDEFYETAQAMTGRPIDGEIQYEVDLMGGGFSWENLPVPTKLLLIMYLTTDPLNPGSLGITTHEFGHTRTMRSPTQMAIDFWCESYATLISIEGLSRIFDQNMWLWETGHHDFFFYHLKGRPLSGRSDEIEAAQFVLAYLEKKFGWDIHYQFFNRWSSELHLKKQVLLTNDFQASEIYATLYSYLANENLAWLFQLAGLNVTESKVREGLKLIKSTLSLDDVSAYIIESDEKTVYFIYPDFTGSKPSGVNYAALSDWTATGFIIGMCSNSQIETTDTDSTIINTNTGMVKLNGKTIVLFGGPIVNAGVNYYEDNRISPLYWRNVAGTYYWYASNGSRLDETGMLISQISAGTQDMFVVEAFLDDSDNSIFIVYGYGWKGTFAGGKFFKFVIYPDIESYTESYYVYRWIDTDADGFVDLEEINTVPVVSG